MSAAEAFDRVEPMVDLPNVGAPPFSLQYLFDKRKPFVRYARQGDIPGISGLPPPEFWLVNPYSLQIDTPVDDRGLIDHNALIAIVKDTIHPSFVWPRELSMDHLYCDEAWYYSAFAPDCAGVFRELSIHKAIVPRVFENWKHQIMVPVAVPSEEVMQLRIESWQIAASLFRSIRKTEIWRQRAERRVAQLRQDDSILKPEFNGVDVIGTEIMTEIMNRHFEGVEENLAKLEQVPAEFRLVDPNKPPLEIA